MEFLETTPSFLMSKKFMLHVLQFKLRPELPKIGLAVQPFLVQAAQPVVQKSSRTDIFI
jgi:hypothetical protein